MGNTLFFFFLMSGFVDQFSLDLVSSCPGFLRAQVCATKPSRCKPFATRWFQTIFFWVILTQTSPGAFSDSGRHEACVFLGLTGMRQRFFSSNGQLGLVATELLSFT